MHKLGTLTVDELCSLWVEYNKSNTSERFGQYVCNRHLQHPPWPELFYCAHDSQAFLLAEDEIVRGDSYVQS